MSANAGQGSEREEAIRRLLAEAVEPVEPGPGAEARLLARARAQQRRRRRPVTAKWALPAVLASLLVVLGVTVVLAAHGGDGSSGSKSSAAGAATAAGPSAAASQALPPPGVASPSRQDSAAEPKAVSPNQLSSLAASGSGEKYSTENRTAAGTALSPVSVPPSDLDGDGTPDLISLGGGKLTAHLSRDGVQAIALPSIGVGSRVLGATLLQNPSGAAVPVVFVRLRQEKGGTSTDTIVSVVNGQLTQLQLGSGPVELTVDADHGYGCNQSALAVSGSTTALVVDGARLVPAPQLRAAAAAATAAGCGF